MQTLQNLYAETQAEAQALLPGCAAALVAAFARVCALSDYVRQQLLRDTPMVAALLDSGLLERALTAEVYVAELADVMAADLDVRLRHCRQRAMVRIIFRDLTRRASLEETTGDLSNLADACIDAALRVHYSKNCQKYGTPTGETSGEPQQMAVLALGKLGAGELNLSSDIDLIFFYAEPGMVVATALQPNRELSNQEFFVRTSRDVIRSLDASLASGFVFRVDMRLRPYGDSGALILNNTAMEKYFYEQGRDWERYAFVKARACAGNLTLGRQFLHWLRPFIYRKHLDYGAVDALREMKRMINTQVVRKEMLDDVKLGPGGIREIEFIVQALQLIWGGREQQLQERRILRAMDLLAEGDFLPAAEVASLRQAYYFLRNTEHAIQAEKDRQTQALPVTSLAQARLAVAMGFADYDAFGAALKAHRRAVSGIFDRFMSANNAEKEELVEGNLFWVSIWRAPATDDAKELLSEAGFREINKVVRLLQDFASRVADRELQDIGSERLERLLPVLLSLAAKEKNPDQSLARLLPIVEQIARRSTYVVYLLENIDALKRVVHLCGMSPWVAERLAEMPILLYELSDRRTHEAVFEKSLLASDLHALLAGAGADDLEAQMDLLRQFKNGAVLKVAVFELLDILPLMKASDALTAIAEVVLAQAVELAWQNMVARFGGPCGVSGESLGCRLALIAYGKLGGFELGYGSDLDLVMLHDADQDGKTNGLKAIDNAVFFHRLVQRIIHILTRYTRFGTVYDIDLRLRPAGNKGPLVSTLSAYARYLRETAWTWEHQALVRARFVAGHPALQVKFDGIRATVLQQPRSRPALLQEVVAMREKMRAHLETKTGLATPLDKSDSGHEVLLSGFDLKHGAGAIVDIEFMVQFAVLASAHDHPEVLRWTDKVRLLEVLEQIGVFSSADRQLLHEAYLAYRAAVHYQWLGGEVASFERLVQYRQRVVDIWQRCMAA